MENKQKYMIVTVESYPFGWETKYFYLLVLPHIEIGDVITSSSGKQYRIVDGRTQLDYEDIDLTKYTPFE